MSLNPGTRLGRYEVQSLLGAGGMGEVYSALATELNRPVALKFLHADVAADSRRMQRFIQEARDGKPTLFARGTTNKDVVHITGFR